MIFETLPHVAKERRGAIGRLARQTFYGVESQTEEQVNPEPHKSSYALLKTVHKTLWMSYGCKKMMACRCSESQPCRGACNNP